MPYVSSVGTDLPCWGTPLHRVAGGDEDAITMAVEAGRAALTDGGAYERAFEAKVRWEAMARDMAWDYPLGPVAPAGFALHVRRYLHESPATDEHLAMVAVKNHHHGVNNSKARLRFEITMEQALNAPTVVTPFRLYDCAPQSDGAAALVIAAEDVVDRFTNRPVWIRGVMAGMAPADADVAEVHDFLTGIG